MNKNLRTKLAIVWENGKEKRYIPRANGHGVGWLVFDQQRAAFLNDRQVSAIDSDALRNEMERPQ